MNFKRIVRQGDQDGRKIGFPTVNFEVLDFGEHYDEGVYSIKISIANQSYSAAMYFGPKMTQPGNVLEAFVLDFNEDIYGMEVSFEVLKKIREPIKFASFEELKKQIQEDLKGV